MSRTATDKTGMDRRLAAAMAIALIAVVASFALGYRLGADRRDEKLHEFIRVADGLGIIDRERLRELTEGSETDGEGFR